MKKSKFKFEIPQNIIIEIGGQKVEITPFISLSEQIAFINSYLETYFKANDIWMDECDIIGAEHALKLAIVDILTSIEICILKSGGAGTVDYNNTASTYIYSDNLLFGSSSFDGTGYNYLIPVKLVGYTFYPNGLTNLMQSPV